MLDIRHHRNLPISGAYLSKWCFNEI